MDALDAPRKVLRVTARLYQRISAQIILVLAFLGLVYFLLYFLLNSTFAARVFDQAVNSQFRGRIGWTRLGWGPVPWRLSILEPVLADSQDRPVITARQIRIDDLHLLDLLDGRIAASDITIEGAVVRLVARPHPESVDELGLPTPLMNISETFLPPPGVVEVDDGMPSSPITLDFTDARILDATFVLDTPDIYIEATGIGIDQGRFRLVSTPDQDVMSMGAERTQVGAAYTLLPAGDLAVPPANAPADAVMRFELHEGVAQYFDWRDDAFKVSLFSARTRGDPFVLQGFAMDLAGPAPTMRAAVTLTSDGMEKHLAPLGIDEVVGPLRIAAKGEGELTSYSARVAAGGEGLSAFGHAVDTWGLEAVKRADDVIELPNLEVDAYGGAVKVEATYDIERADAVALVEVRNLDPARLPLLRGQAVVRDYLRGPVTTRVRVHGVDLISPARRVSATVDLDHRRTGVAVPGLARRSRLRSILGLHGDVATVHRLRLDAGADSVDVKGELALDTLEGRISGSVDVQDLSQVGEALGLPMRGRISANVDASGPLSAPRGSATLRGRGLGWADYPTANIDGQLRLAGRTAYVDALEVVTDVGQLSAKGAVALEARPTLDLGVRLRGLELSAVPLELDIGGRIGTPRPIRIQGPVDDPRVDGVVLIRRPRYGDLSMRSIKIEGGWAQRTARLTTLEVKGLDGARVIASGSFDTRRLAYEADLALEALPLTLIDAFTANPTGLEGTVSMTLKGAGTVQAPRAEGTLKLEGLVYADTQFKDTTITFEADGAEARVKSAGLLGALALDAQVPLTAGRTGTATLSFEGLDPQAIMPTLKDRAWSATTTGAITARFDALGGLLHSVEAELSALDGAFRVFDAQGEVVQTPGYTCPGCPTVGVAVARPIRLAFRHGVATIEECTLAVNDQRIGLAGTIGIDKTVDLAVGGNLELGLLRPFLSGVFTNIAGAAELELGVVGPLSAPHARGWVRLERMEATPRASIIGNDVRLAQPVEFEISPPAGDDGAGMFSIKLPARTRATAARPSVPNRFALMRDETEVRVERLGVLMGKGGLERLFAGVSATELNVFVPATLRAAVNLDGVLFEMFQHREPGKPPEMRLKLGGDVEVLHATYTADIGTGAGGVTDNFTGRARASTVSVFERVPLLKRLSLDLRIHGDDEIYLKNRLAVLELDVEMKMDVTAKGFLVGESDDDSEDLLKLSGNVSMLDGSELIYQRRPFEVTSGTVDFGISPFVQAKLVARHTFQFRTDEGQVASSFDVGGGEVREEEVTLDVTVVVPNRNAAAEIDPQLSSSSGASKIEILTLLLTGRYPSDLTGAAAGQPATEALLSPVLSLLEAPLEETLSLDLSLTPVTSGTLFVDVDKVLSRRLRLYSRTPVGDDALTNPQVFGLEYRLNNAVTGELTTESLGTANATSGRLRLRWELD